VFQNLPEFLAAFTHLASDAFPNQDAIALPISVTSFF
jgi:hypothetical protein